MGGKRWCWVWPNDGRRKGTFGPIRDVLTSKGPDIHLSNYRSTQKIARSKWSRWGALDPEYFFHDDSWPAAKHADRKNQRYNFRTRKYEDPHPKICSGVKWSENPDQKEPLIWACRDRHGQWYNNSPAEAVQLGGGASPWSGFVPGY